MKEVEKNPNEKEQRQLPSFFSSWKQLYAFAFAELLLLIVLFYQFTDSFSGY